MNKNILREELLRRRAEIENNDEMAARLVGANLIMLPELDDKKSIAGYYPMGNELDCLTILKMLHAGFYEISLPTIVAKHQALQFREWDLVNNLTKASFGTSEPDGSASIVLPEVLLVPLLGFDLKGYRLGYGGGYYDRTIAGLRKNNPKILAIGIAYEGQMVDRIPTESHDQRLDMVITEKSIYRIENR